MWVWLFCIGCLLLLWWTNRRHRGNEAENLIDTFRLNDSERRAARNGDQTPGEEDPDWDSLRDIGKPRDP